MIYNLYFSELFETITLHVTILSCLPICTLINDGTDRKQLNHSIGGEIGGTGQLPPQKFELGISVSC